MSAAKKRSVAKKHPTTKKAKHGATAKSATPSATPAVPGRTGGAGGLLAQLDRIERGRGDGELLLPDGSSLRVTSLGKVYFPASGFTKGDLMRHLVRVAPAMLPAIADRPLSLKRYPDGIDGQFFFQQKPGAHVAKGVRIERVETEAGSADRFIGGDLLTLLYLAQIGSIELHAWHSRVGSLDVPDYCVLDLDPSPGVDFSNVVRLARGVREEIRALKLHAALKTTGSRGLHLVVPLPRNATWTLSAEVAEAIAVRAAAEFPKLATVERSLARRAPRTIYVDHMQNAMGKTAVAVFSARARPAGTVSAPVRWSQATARLRTEAFTLATVGREMAALRKIWTAGLAGR